MGLDLLGKAKFFAMTSPTGSRVAFDRHGPWLFALLSLVPFIWCRPHFAQLFWFGDDWDLLDQISRIGLWRWTWTIFAENFVPVFKLGWGALVFAGGGSYFPMIAALWLTHALNVALLGQLLRQEGFGWGATALVLTVFGLASVNIETLAWSVQWSAILAITFFLLAVRWQARHEAAVRSWNWRVHGVLTVLVAASALSFSRGILTGAALAVVSLVPVAAGPWQGRARWLTAGICLLPGVVVAGLIFALATGNHQQLASGSAQFGRMIQFGLYYFSLNPLHHLLEMSAWGPATAICLGLLKLLLVGWCLLHSSGRTRHLLLLFLVLDLGNAALLGVGRYHTGLEASMGSRYHYNALLCTLPFVGYWFEAMLAFALRNQPVWRAGLTVLVVVLASWRVARNWEKDARQWATWRGTNTRALLFHDSHPPEAGALPGIPSMKTERAKELVAEFHLH